MTVPNQRKEVINNQYIKKIKIKYQKGHSSQFGKQNNQNSVLSAEICRIKCLNQNTASRFYKK